MLKVKDSGQFKKDYFNVIVSQQKRSRLPLLL